MRYLSGLICSLGLAAAVVAGASALEPRSGVTLRALDKITGNSIDLKAKAGETITFGRLSITVRACYQAPPEDTPESAAFLEVQSTAPSDRAPLPGAAVQQASSQQDSRLRDDGRIFSGWMFASSPGLSALEHPTYDVWVISCSAS